MKISPISYSNRQNYSLPAFEGGNREKKHHNSRVTNTLKAIPLATLLAMSPMTSVNAQEPVSKTASTTQTAHYKPVIHSSYDNATPKDSHISKNHDCELYFISTDGNDENIEELELVFRGEDVKKGYKKVGSQSYDAKRKIVSSVNLESLEIHHNKRLMGKDTTYHARGKGEIYTEPYIVADGTKDGEYSFKKQGVLTVEISKGFYDYLADILGQEVKYKTVDIDWTDTDILSIYFSALSDFPWLDGSLMFISK